MGQIYFIKASCSFFYNLTFLFLNLNVKNLKSEEIFCIQKKIHTKLEALIKNILVGPHIQKYTEGHTDTF